MIRQGRFPQTVQDVKTVRNEIETKRLPLHASIPRRTGSGRRSPGAPGWDPHRAPSTGHRAGARRAADAAAAPAPRRPVHSQLGTTF